MCHTNVLSFMQHALEIAWFSLCRDSPIANYLRPRSCICSRENFCTPSLFVSQDSLRGHGGQVWPFVGPHMGESEESGQKSWELRSIACWKRGSHWNRSIGENEPHRCRCDTGSGGHWDAGQHLELIQSFRNQCCNMPSDESTITQPNTSFPWHERGEHRNAS